MGPILMCEQFVNKFGPCMSLPFQYSQWWQLFTAKSIFGGVEALSAHISNLVDPIIEIRVSHHFLELRRDNHVYIYQVKLLSEVADMLNIDMSVIELRSRSAYTNILRTGSAEPGMTYADIEQTVDVVWTLACNYVSVSQSRLATTGRNH